MPGTLESYLDLQHVVAADSLVVHVVVSVVGVTSVLILDEREAAPSC